MRVLVALCHGNIFASNQPNILWKAHKAQLCSFSKPFVLRGLPEKFFKGPLAAYTRAICTHKKYYLMCLK